MLEAAGGRLVTRVGLLVDLIGIHLRSHRGRGLPPHTGTGAQQTQPSCSLTPSQEDAQGPRGSVSEVPYGYCENFREEEGAQVALPSLWTPGQFQFT